MSTAIDPEAALWSAEPGEREGRPLLVLMHGRRGDPGDRLAMAPALPAEFVIVSVQAPIAEEGRWSWFDPARNPSGDPRAEDADRAADAVLRWLETLPFTPSLIGTLGFSQGAQVATEVDRDRLSHAQRMAACQWIGKPDDTRAEPIQVEVEAKGRPC